YKAPGPDGIPNIILQKSANCIIDYLFYIYSAILSNRWYYNGWKEFTTVVIKKPGKPSYQTPKAIGI
ncbi:hypothetical protein BDQ17DRAFT_1256839, partial [Cyathus striatus]